MRALHFLAAALVISGCVTDQMVVGSPTGAILSSAAAQVKRCYRGPRASHAGRQIVTTIRVRITSEGFPDGLPIIVSQQGVNPSNSAFADRMAQAAIAAVMRCTPLNLPAEFYEDGWQEFELTFSPFAAA